MNVGFGTVLFLMVNQIPLKDFQARFALIQGVRGDRGAYRKSRNCKAIEAIKPVVAGLNDNKVLELPLGVHGCPVQLKFLCL